jgi:hypothetical protein
MSTRIGYFSVCPLRDALHIKDTLFHITLILQIHFKVAGNELSLGAINIYLSVDYQLLYVLLFTYQRCRESNYCNSGFQIETECNVYGPGPMFDREVDNALKYYGFSYPDTTGVVFTNMVNSYFLTRRNLRDVIIVLSLASAALFPVSNAKMYLAFGLLGLGCFLHFVSKGILIRNVVLCNKGIYQVVRHPYYLANYLIDCSFCLLSGNLFLVVFYPFLFFWAYGPTIRGEEQVLFDRHRDSFIKDSQEIPQVFPDIVSIRNIRALFTGFSAKRITLKECSRITKFCATGLFLTLIHEVNAEGLIGGLKEMLIPTKLDYDEFLLALFATALYITSIITLRFSKQNRYVPQERFKV